MRLALDLKNLDLDRQGYSCSLSGPSLSGGKKETGFEPSLERSESGSVSLATTATGPGRVTAQCNGFRLDAEGYLEAIAIAP